MAESTHGDWDAPEDMKEIHSRLRSIGIEPYDCLSFDLMDVLATQVAKLKTMYPLRVGKL